VTDGLQLRLRRSRAACVRGRGGVGLLSLAAGHQAQQVPGDDRAALVGAERPGVSSSCWFPSGAGAAESDALELKLPVRSLLPLAHYETDAGLEAALV